MTKVIGRRYFSETEGILGDDGFWKIISGIGESRTSDGEDWETLYIDAMSLDDDFDRGYRTALSSALNEFVEKVTNRGFTSLFDAEEFDQNMKAKLEDKNVKTNSKSNKTAQS